SVIARVARSSSGIARASAWASARRSASTRAVLSSVPAAGWLIAPEGATAQVPPGSAPSRAGPARVAWEAGPARAAPLRPVRGGCAVARPGSTRRRRSPSNGTRTTAGVNGGWCAPCWREVEVGGASAMANPRPLSLRRFGWIGLHEVHGLSRHDRGDGVFIDELRVTVASQKNAEIVEPGDDPL